MGSLEDLQAGIGDRSVRGGGHQGRAGGEGGPDDVGQTVAGIEEAVLGPVHVVEDDHAVGESECDFVAEILVAVGQLEDEFGSGSEVEGVESGEAGPRADAVVGGVFQVEFESGLDLRGGREYDLSVVGSEAVAVVVESADGFAVDVDALGRGRVDDVPHGVGQRLGVCGDASQAACGGGCGTEPAGRESHPVDGCGGVSRGVGAADVERSEEFRVEEPALDAVSGVREYLFDECGQVQEGVVILHGEEPFGGEQVRGAVLLFVFVAVDGEEADGRVVRPTLPDVRRCQPDVPVDAQVFEFAAYGLFGPVGTAVADFEFEPVVLHGQQADAASDQPGPLCRELGPMQRVVESFGRIGILGESEDRSVAFRDRDFDFQRPSFACAVDRFGAGGIVSGYGDRTLAEVAVLSVDFQFHEGLFLGRTTISSEQSMPWRWITASSERTSTGTYSPLRRIHTSGERSSPASASNASGVS